jgi:hypothetical protein
MEWGERNEIKLTFIFFILLRTLEIGMNEKMRRLDGIE